VIILACTELPLAFTEVVSKPLLINTLELQCLAGVDFVLEDYQP
jgi:aspartate/glutamate racemase